MANRVNVNINVSDHSRAGLAELRTNMRRMQADVRRAGGDIRFNVRVDPAASRAELRRVTRALRGEPVTIRTRLDPPTPPARTLRQRIMLALRRGVTVPVRFASNRIARGLLAAVRGPARVAGRFIGGMLSDGIGQGIIGAFQAAGPVGVAILAGIIVSSLALIGAALAGVLVFAIGGAITGLGVYLAAQSDLVKNKWSEASESIKDSFRGTADALIPSINRAIGLLDKMAADFAPHFEQAMTQTAPAIDRFVSNFDRALRSFGRRAFDPLMEGFDAFLLAFGPEFDTFMQGLGDSMGALGRTVRDHSGEIAMAVRMVLGLITTAIDIVNFFANAWVLATRLITYNFGMILNALAVLVDSFFSATSSILGAADAAFGWIPGVGDKIKNAQRDFNEFGDGIVADLRRSSEEAINWGSNMDKANKKRKLEVDISSLKAKLQLAREDLQRTANKKAKAKIQANIDDLTRKLKSARGQLNALNGKTATTYVVTRYSSITTYNPNGNGPGGIPKRTGGVVGRAATGGVRNNMTMVGEQGPEMVDLPVGSRVRSNSDSRRLASQGGGGGPVELIVKSGGSKLEDLLVELLRKTIRIQGGNVQNVLGTA